MQKSIFINFKQFLIILLAAAATVTAEWCIGCCENAQIEWISAAGENEKWNYERGTTDNHSIKMQHPLKSVNMSHYEPRENESQTKTTTKYTQKRSNDSVARKPKWKKSPLSSKTRYKMQLNFHKQFHIEIVKMSCTVVVLMLSLSRPYSTYTHANTFHFEHPTISMKNRERDRVGNSYSARTLFCAFMRIEAWICEHEIV